jgi:hypothetical protein
MAIHNQISCWNVGRDGNTGRAVGFTQSKVFAETA